MTLELRPAQSGDLPAIRDLQIASWQRAYRGMLGDDFLDSRVPAVLADRWAVLPGPEWLVLCAWGPDGLLGFVSVDRARAGGAYVDNLHVRAVAQGQGIGRRLMAAAARDVLDHGGETLWLTVIRENAPTRAFYRRIGGEEGADQDDCLYGEAIVSLPVRWGDLESLAALTL